MDDNKVKNKYSIVLVDDDKFLLNMYSMKFTKEGMGVQAIQSAEEALDKFRTGLSPDILLLDVVMPGMDGMELLETIRKENLIPNTTVIILSNQGQPSDIDRAQKLNVDGFIVKATTIPSEVLKEVLRITEEKDKK